MLETEDIANLLSVLILVIGLRLTGRLQALAFWVFLGRVLAVFLTNDVLFPVTYMPDQLGYLRCTMMGRGGDPEWCTMVAGKNVKAASEILTYFPLPFVVSVRSIALMNTVMIILLFVYLDGKGFLSEKARLLYLFYPSFILYSAIGTRDVMIFVCMILAIYFLFERRSFLLGLLWLSPLLWIKMQNAVMTVIPFLMVLIAGRSKKRMIVALVAGLVLTLVGLIGLGFLNDLNKYRASFYAEDGGVGQVELLTAGVSLPIELLLSAWFFLVKPFPWAAGGAFQAIQSLENLTVCWIVFLYWMRQAKKSMEVDFVNLKIFVVASLAIYGVVVFNYGTAARYRFPFVLIFVLFADRMTLPPVKKTTPAEKIG